jgi:hypothetical protein
MIVIDLFASALPHIFTLSFCCKTMLSLKTEGSRTLALAPPMFNARTKENSIALFKLIKINLCIIKKLKVKDLIPDQPRGLKCKLPYPSYNMLKYSS